MSHVDQAWLDKLDAATDYVALFRSQFGEPRKISGDEVWAKCPIHDDCDDPGKWSMSVKNGQWGCFKHDEHGSMIGLMKKLTPKSWRDKWIAACPATKEVFGIEDRSKKSDKKSDSTRHTVDHDLLYRDGLRSTTDADLQPLAEKWSIPVAVLRKQGWFVLRGGHEGGDHPKYCLPILDPTNGKVCGIRIRFLPPYPIKKDKDGKEHETKSRLMTDSKVGIFGDGLSRLLDKTPEGIELPVLFCEGEKDWAVASAVAEGWAVVSLSHGSGSSGVPMRDLLKDRDVTVLYDEDDAGNKGSRTLLTTLVNSARTLKWAHIGQPKKDIFNIVRDDGGGAPALLALIEKAEPFSMKEALADVRAVIQSQMDDEAPPEVVPICDTIYKVLADAGALWLKTRNADGYCVYNGRVYECSVADPGWALRIGEWTGIDSFGSIGQRIHRQLHALAVERGTECDTTAWYARDGDGLYLPLCDREQHLVELRPTGMRPVANGKNGVVVLPSPHMRPIAWIEDEKFNFKEAGDAWLHFFSMFTCPNEDRRLLEAFVLMMPLYDWVDTHPIFRFSGAPGSGKSSAAKLLTVLMYGDERLFKATNAATYRISANSPLVCMDNVEADNVDENLELFFLLAATGAEKLKSAMDSPTRTISERVRSWVLTTGVDPISNGKREIVERTVIVPFGGNTSDGFMPKAAVVWVRENRDLLWNLIFRRTWSTISAIKDGALDRVVRSLNKKVRPRLREFYALASVALGSYDKADDTIAYMTDAHGEDESTATIEDNPIVDLLSFVPTFIKTESGKSVGVPFSENGDGWQTDWVQTQRLGILLSMTARAAGRPYPFRSTQQMSTRLGLVRAQLDALGFKLERNENLMIDGKRVRAWRLFIPRRMGRQETLFGAEAS